MGIERIEILSQDGSGDAVSVGKERRKHKGGGCPNVLVVEPVDWMTVVEGKLCGKRILAHVPQIGVEEDDVADAVWILNRPI